MSSRTTVSKQVQKNGLSVSSQTTGGSGIPPLRKDWISRILLLRKDWRSSPIDVVDGEVIYVRRKNHLTSDVQRPPTADAVEEKFV